MTALRRIPLLSLIAATMSLIVQALPAGAFDSAYWKPPRPPGWHGPLAKNHKLTDCKLIGKGILEGPEDVAVDPDGRVYCGSSRCGKIYRTSFTADGSEHTEVFAETTGVNLGLKLMPDGNLYVCNVPQGLLMVSPKGEVRVLAGKTDAGTPITFADDLDIDSAGKVYFSNASSKYNGLNGARPLRFDLLEGKPMGPFMSTTPPINQPNCWSTVSTLPTAWRFLKTKITFWSMKPAIIKPLVIGLRARKQAHTISLPRTYRAPPTV